GSGLLSTWTFSGVFFVPLASSPLLSAKPVARESADPPNKRMLNTSGLSDFLVIDTFVWLFPHYGPTELTNALLEYYKMVRNHSPSDAERRHASAQPLRGKENRSLECNLLAIATRSATINNDKVALPVKRK